MTSSEAEDDLSRSVSPDYSGGEQDGGEMAEHPDNQENGASQTGLKSSSNAKDPLRPRRKKARRACFACQRAHLTCGDERPCQRCIKRGLQDACQDGVRKKAKYLHDAPNEALMPGAGGNLFNHAAALRNNIALQNAEAAQHQQTQFFQTTQQFNAFPQNDSMPPPLIHHNSMSSANFNQPTPIPPAFDMSGHHQNMRNPNVGQPQSDPTASIPHNWNGALFDPSDPALFNFDLASMNFGNHYGALEFGMLGHMATGADATPPSDTATQRGSIGHTNGANQYSIPLGSFSESPTTHRAFPYPDSTMPEWSNGQNLYGQQFHSTDSPHAFAIEMHNANFTSPDSASSPPGLLKFEESPTIGSSNFRSSTATSAPGNNNTLTALVPKLQNQLRQPTQLSTPQLTAKSQLPVKSDKRPRDPSSIYTTVTSPYSYTTGFHSLIAYLQRRFATSPSKTLTIAKSLASIRPSFIATTKTLNRDDLIFMEKCFQRTLWEYEGFIEGVGTPTIVARRTGEIAAVGKEFSILTGWKKDVLLGRKPNLNINRGGSTGVNSAAPGSGANTKSGATGVNTPTLRSTSTQQIDSGEEKRLQPVFLAELLDDESVVEFYEGFARLAFGDSRGSVMGKGKLLKYRTKEEQIAMELEVQEAAVAAVSNDNIESRAHTTTRDAGFKQRAPDGHGLKRTNTGVAKKYTDLKKEGISGESGMQNLGFKDGKVECTYCWTVKRDVFDIPMLIVMNPNIIVAASARTDVHNLANDTERVDKRPASASLLPLTLFGNSAEREPETEYTFFVNIISPSHSLENHLSPITAVTTTSSKKMRPDGPRDPVAGPDSGPEPPFPIKLSGPVIKGFGRGSAELGIPTANIPPSGLSAYPDLPTGVYYGLVGLRHSTNTKNNNNTDVIYPSVLSIGYNPFYKNTVRSIEIHILHSFAADFYHSPLNLLILGFIRPEYDYVSKESLIEDIMTDCDVARTSLARQTYKADSEGEKWLLDFSWVGTKDEPIASLAGDDPAAAAAPVAERVGGGGEEMSKI